MSELPNPLFDVDHGNIVDRASDSADRLLESTRQTASSAIDSVAAKVHAVRDRASPALDRLTSPVDTIVRRTHEAPITSLMVAAATGAVLMLLIGLVRR
ncbi:MAG TPA: hypothetical protein VNU71_20625 [Burkholderiaceae bacterium]|nr:hypothetical protein [Burkholderiaceae bacterium]